MININWNELSAVSHFSLRSTGIPKITIVITCCRSWIGGGGAWSIWPYSHLTWNFMVRWNYRIISPGTSIHIILIHHSMAIVTYWVRRMKLILSLAWHGHSNHPHPRRNSFCHNRQWVSHFFALYFVKTCLIPRVRQSFAFSWLRLLLLNFIEIWSRLAWESAFSICFLLLSTNRGTADKDTWVFFCSPVCVSLHVEVEPVCSDIDSGSENLC